jgi:hypothetical protein
MLHELFFKSRNTNSRRPRASCVMVKRSRDMGNTIAEEEPGQDDIQVQSEDTKCRHEVLFAGRYVDALCLAAKATLSGGASAATVRDATMQREMQEWRPFFAFQFFS